jgi:hypothetical protein
MPCHFFPVTLQALTLSYIRFSKPDGFRVLLSELTLLE